MVLFASSAKDTAFVAPGAGAATKSGPPKAPFVVTEFQQPWPLLGLVLATW